MDRVILFTRYPRTGTTKKRLVPRLGPKGAAEFQRRMAEHVYRRLFPLMDEGYALEVRSSGGSDGLLQSWLGDGPCYRQQGEDTLARRMAEAFRQAFEEGAHRVVLVMSDAPGLSAAYVRRAFHALDDADVVLGPARDGGHVLIGCTRYEPQLFDDSPEDETGILPHRLHRARSTGLAVSMLPPLADVDHPEDLPVWEQNADESDALPLSLVSVIIPTYQSATYLGEVLMRASAPGVERIVVDGGSTDATGEIARGCGAALLQKCGNRAQRMNYAAKQAAGKILLFLYPDILLPRGFAETVRRALLGSRRWGAFELDIVEESFVNSLVEKGANFRSRRFKLPFGDQALFFTRSLFTQMGGFPTHSLMEDVELVHRLAKAMPPVVVRPPVRSPAREDGTRSIFKTVLANQMLLGAHAIGVSPGRLVRKHHNR
ncbi:MAG: TIGR04282 family arsenosugar biosynthesis glycosyltransferase [Synergistales bacterium]|nr:TIGR04282 family arsenosugar biosynthesis glycosyltransferase [Synergistales bacterium]